VQQTPIHNSDGETTYRLRGDKQVGHHHLICRRCGRAKEVAGPAIERWTTEVAAGHGYIDVDRTVEVFGVCPSCAKD
jgi:Fur family ferric uptake transcriptional regulator